MPERARLVGPAQSIQKLLEDRVVWAALYESLFGVSAHSSVSYLVRTRLEFRPMNGFPDRTVRGLPLPLCSDPETLVPEASCHRRRLLLYLPLISSNTQDTLWQDQVTRSQLHYCFARTGRLKSSWCFRRGRLAARFCWHKSRTCCGQCALSSASGLSDRS